MTSLLAQNLNYNPELTEAKKGRIIPGEDEGQVLRQHLKNKIISLAKALEFCAYDLENIKDQQLKNDLIVIYDGLPKLFKQIDSLENTKVVKGNYVVHVLGNFESGLALLLRILNGKTKPENAQTLKKITSLLAEEIKEWTANPESFSQDLGLAPKDYT